MAGLRDHIYMPPSGLEMAGRGLRHGSDIVISSGEALLTILSLLLLLLLLLHLLLLQSHTNCL